ncbi:MAG TPA: DUF2293 domain-containing protein [Lacunisphaera sp.]|nr:DUF2293 domain-containing protein [Lacunisphaera sp.]
MATEGTEGAKTKPEDIVVFLTRRNGKCAECGTDLFDGTMIRLENDRALCLDCADLGHLEYLPSGNTALTRRATKHSPLRAVVVQWSRTRQRYERQGILVTGEAIDRAEKECLADAEVRARQRERAANRREEDDAQHLAAVTAAIRAAFPGCPAGTPEAIAAWTCRKHSGRVGRSAAAKSLDPAALRLAVIAHIRHEHTEYDLLLMQTGDRAAARAAVRPEIDEILARWTSPGGQAG